MLPLFFFSKFRFQILQKTDQTQLTPAVNIFSQTFDRYLASNRKMKYVNFHETHMFHGQLVTQANLFYTGHPV